MLSTLFFPIWIHLAEATIASGWLFSRGWFSSLITWKAWSKRIHIIYSGVEMTKQIFVYLQLAPHRWKICARLGYDDTPLPVYIRNPIFVTGHVKPFLQCRCQCLLVVFSAVNVFVLKYLLQTTCLPSDLKKARKVSSVSVFTTLSLRTATYFPRLSRIFHGVWCGVFLPGRGEGHRCARQTYDRQQVGWGHPGTRSIEMKGKKIKKTKKKRPMNREKT